MEFRLKGVRENVLKGVIERKRDEAPDGWNTRLRKE
jgi:hypothetical protein